MKGRETECKKKKDTRHRKNGLPSANETHTHIKSHIHTHTDRERERDSQS
jgi:hypothetical protein